MKKLTNKQNFFSALAIIIVIVGGGFAYGGYSSNVRITEAKETLQVSTKELESLDKKIDDLYYTEDSDFFKESIEESEIEKLQTDIINLANLNKEPLLKSSDYADFDKKVSALKNKMKTTKNKYRELTWINSLFEQDGSNRAIHGLKVNNDLAIAYDLYVGLVEGAKSEYFTEGATSTYEKAVNDLLTNAESQYNQLAIAKEAVGKICFKGYVIKTDTALYDTAKTEVDKIKNEKEKNKLNDQLAKVKEAIDQKAAEQQTATQSAAQEATASNSTGTESNQS